MTKLKELNIELDNARFTLRVFDDGISIFTIRKGEEDWLPLVFDKKQKKQIIDLLTKSHTRR